MFVAIFDCAQALKKELTVQQFVRKFQTQMPKGYYADVEALYWYVDFEYLFVVKKGRRWEFDALHNMAPSKKKYITFFGDDKTVHSDVLEIVEKALFKSALKAQK